MSIDFIYPILSEQKRQQLMDAASSALHAQQKLNEQHGGLLQYLLGGADGFVQFQHYPRTGDRIDYETGAQYYYHCHREDIQRDEHGHFHSFIRAKQIPSELIPHKEANQQVYDVSPMTHLIAIAVNRVGEPIRLFTTNRHVAKEQWYDAEALNRLNNQFHLSIEKYPQWQLVDQWMEGVFTLFTPQITWLQQQRDRRIEQLKNEIDCDNIYEYQEIEELSSLSVSVQAQAQWLMDDMAHALPDEKIA